MQNGVPPTPTGTDWKFVDNVFGAILDKYGEDVDSRTIPDPCGVVLLVYHTHGLLMNGGFHYLFEGNYNDDPGFVRTRNAFRLIGAANATEAFDRAFGCFPNSELPNSIDERLELYTRSYSIEDTFEGVATPDSLYWSSEDEIRKSLVAYISCNNEYFPLG